MSEFLLKLPKPAAIAIQATLGVALSAPSAVPALGADAAPGNTATESQIKSVQGNWVISTCGMGDTAGFSLPASPLPWWLGRSRYPPDDANPQTTGQKSPTEPSIRRSGSFVVGVIQAASDKPIRIPPRRVPIRLAGTSMNPGTRPARVFQLQQGNGINNQNWPVSPRATSIV